MQLVDPAKRTAANKAIDCSVEDPRNHMETMMEAINRMVPDGLFPSQRKAFEQAISDRNNWYEVPHMTPVAFMDYPI